VTNSFQEQLIRGLVHKLNNILSLLHGYGGMLMEDKHLDERTREIVGRMIEGADLGTALSERLTLLMQPSSLVWREVDLPEMVGRLHSSLAFFWERGVHMEVRLADALPQLWTDARLLQIVLEELVKNASQASEENGVVEIEASELSDKTQRHQRGTRAEQPTRFIEIRVIDHGEGIPAERADKVYAPFFSTRAHPDGMGLGLPIVLRLAESLGGRVYFTSQPGRTVFHLRLPVRPGTGG